MKKKRGPPKGMSPAESKRRTTIAVLKLFESKEKMSWNELWDKVKPSRKGEQAEIPYPTLKRVVKRLVKNGLVKASVDKELTPVFTLIAPLPHILYLDEVVEFLEKQFEGWRSSPFPESFTSGVLFSEILWEKLAQYIEPEDEMKIHEANIVLHRIRERIILDKLGEVEKQAILKYRRKVEELVEKTYAGVSEEMREFIEAVAPNYSLKEHEELTKMDVSLILLDPRQIDRFLSKCRPEKRREVEPLAFWLKENRKLYDKYLEKQKEGFKLLLAVGVGFGDYIDEWVRRTRLLPVEWVLNEKEKADPKLKEKVKEKLDSFEKAHRSTLYRCEVCSELFNNKKKAWNHVRYVHKTNSEDMVVEVDRAYYEEIFNRLD